MGLLDHIQRQGREIEAVRKQSPDRGALGNGNHLERLAEATSLLPECHCRRHPASFTGVGGEWPAPLSSTGFATFLFRLQRIRRIPDSFGTAYPPGGVAGLSRLPGLLRSGHRSEARYHFKAPVRCRQAITSHSARNCMTPKLGHGMAH